MLNSTKSEMKEYNSMLYTLKECKISMFYSQTLSLKQQGKNVISLSVGEPDFDTPKPINEAAIEAIKNGFTKYTETVGLLQLREDICKKLSRENNINYTPECIVLSNGAKQSIWQAIMALCNPSDEVLIPAPYWTNYPEMAVMAGATPKFITCHYENDFLMEPEQLEKSITDKSRILILCTPNNPTGAVYSKEQLEEIAKVVKRYPRLKVLSDEIYEYIVFAPVKHYSIASIPGMFEKTITINGFSKGFAMTGWRVGYMAAPIELTKECAKIQGHVTSSPCAISQKAAIAALAMGNYGGPIVKNMVDEFRKRRDFVYSRLKSIQGIKVSKPKGAFYFFPNVSAFFGDNVSHDNFGPVKTVEDLCYYILLEALVTTVPGDIYGNSECLRISYSNSMDDLKESLDRIECALSNLSIMH